MVVHIVMFQFKEEDKEQNIKRAKEMLEALEESVPTLKSMEVGIDFSHKERKISILITTHYMSEAEFCDRVVLLREGRKIADDTVANLYAANREAKSFEEIFLGFYRKSE